MDGCMISVLLFAKMNYTTCYLSLFYFFREGSYLFLIFFTKTLAFVIQMMYICRVINL